MRVTWISTVRPAHVVTRPRSRSSFGEPPRPTQGRPATRPPWRMSWGLTVARHPPPVLAPLRRSASARLVGVASPRVAERAMPCDIELRIGRGSAPGEYRVQVVHAEASGEPESTLALDVEGLLARRDELE